jgi:3-dehydroquinate dehydratase II
MTRRILILNGPNLNMLGRREQAIYGSETLEEINNRIASLAGELKCEIRTCQSNSEGVLIDAIQDAYDWADAIIVNAGAYTHTSYALRDAIADARRPTVEVHLSNVLAREAFRRHSVITPVCSGVISGFGGESYILALRAAKALADRAA